MSKRSIGSCNACGTSPCRRPPHNLRRQAASSPSSNWPKCRLATACAVPVAPWAGARDQTPTTHSLTSEKRSERPEVRGAVRTTCLSACPFRSEAHAIEALRGLDHAPIRRPMSRADWLFRAIEPRLRQAPDDDNCHREGTGGHGRAQRLPRFAEDRWFTGYARGWLTPNERGCKVPTQTRRGHTRG